jgi:hypothetical protein
MDDRDQAQAQAPGSGRTEAETVRGRTRTIESRGLVVLCECYGMTKLGLDGSAKWWNESTLCDCVDWYAAILPCSLGCMSLRLPVLSACTAGSCVAWNVSCIFCATSSEWHAPIR